MHWNKRTNVSRVKPRTSLPKPERPLHKLHVRGRQPGNHVAERRRHGPGLFAPHQRSNRVRADFAREREARRAAEPANHPRKDFVQAFWAWRIRTCRYAGEDGHASAPVSSRYALHPSLVGSLFIALIWLGIHRTHLLTPFVGVAYKLLLWPAYIHHSAALRVYPTVFQLYIVKITPR